jgi:SAM-dependent methyltransferase
LETSLALIKRSVSDRTASTIDVGGGESSLVDDLLEQRFQNITVLDVSQAAIDVNKKRLGERAAGVHWIVADITEVELVPGAYDVWHDRAVFHFLTTPEQRTAYVRQVSNSVKPGGHVIVSTFGTEGPTKCSGLDVVRYNAESLGDSACIVRPHTAAGTSKASGDAVALAQHLQTADFDFSVALPRWEAERLAAADRLIHHGWRLARNSGLAQ